MIIVVDKLAHALVDPAAITGIGNNRTIITRISLKTDLHAESS